MKAIGKIGIIIPEITDSLDFSVIDGMYSQARKLGYDLLLFTGIYNTHASQGYNEYRKALDNIYTLPQKAELDALILAGDRFVSEDIIRFCDRQIRDVTIPKVMLHHPMDGYINIFPMQEEYMYRMTKHMIEEHHCRRIYCLAGVQGEIATMERLAGFQRAMDEAGIPYSDSDIIYGYFWRDVPYQLGRDIGNGVVERPEAVVCMNDFMAAALIKGLQECGLSVPEDIAVTGYDGNWISTFTDPQITTIVGRDIQLGALAIALIHEILTGEKTEIPEGIQKISVRGSCGCPWHKENNPVPDTSFMKFSKNMLDQYYHRKEFITSDFMTNVTTADSLEELIERIKGYRQMLYNAIDMDICLCEDWKLDFKNTDNYRRSGYSDYMISILSEQNGAEESIGRLFSVKKLVPYLMAEHEPMLTVFTSLFCKNQILGYVTTSFREVSDICIDEYYVNWCDSVANGFRAVQEKMYKDYIQREVAQRTLHDPNTGLLNKRGLLEQAKEFIAYGKQYGVLLMAHRENDDSMAKSGFEPHQLIANAIRLTTDKKELYARISDHIFCIILPLEEAKNGRGTAEKRLLDIEKRIHYMHGNMRNLFRFEIELDFAELSGCDLMYLDELLIKHMQVLSQKVYGDVPYGNTLKEQLYRLRHEIMLHPQKEWSMDGIASELGVSVSYLQHSYKAEFSVSCFDDIIMARIEKAKQLLTSADLRIIEVAEQCGYQSNRHFTRQFRQYTGVTPTEFRKTANS